MLNSPSAGQRRTRTRVLDTATCPGPKDCQKSSSLSIKVMVVCIYLLGGHPTCAHFSQGLSIDAAPQNSLSQLCCITT